MNKEEKILKESIDLNIWDNIEDVIEVINLMKQRKWSWYKNMKCKYINLRIDMRDSKCIIEDRDGNRITPKMLKRQHEQTN